MKLYIAGPMTGYEDYNRGSFRYAQSYLEAEGFEVVNPAPYEHPGWEWADYLKRDIPLLLGCDGVATLRGWQESAGASLEVLIAQRLGMPVRPVILWEEK